MTRYSKGVFRVTLVLCLTAMVYPAEKFPEYPVRPARDYSAHVEAAGLIVAVEPVENLKDQKTYFKTELAPKGFLPIFVVVENHASVDSFLFDKTKVLYGQGDSKDLTPDARSKPGEAVMIGSLAAISIAGMFVALKLMSNASLVQENILKKEVQSKTLPPGGSVHGFLYVPVPKKAAREKIRLRVPATRAGTQEQVPLDVVF